MRINPEKGLHVYTRRSYRLDRKTAIKRPFSVICCTDLDAMDNERIQLVLIATTSGNVIYERFYERLGEQEKAEMRASIADAAESGSTSTSDGSEYASRYRQGREESTQYAVDHVSLRHYPKLLLTVFLLQRQCHCLPEGGRPFLLRSWSWRL